MKKFISFCKKMSARTNWAGFAAFTQLARAGFSLTRWFIDHFM